MCVCICVWCAWAKVRICLSVFKVPFRSRGHNDAALEFPKAQAIEWLDVAFGRGQCSLTDIPLCAAASLSSRMSVWRSQLVAATACHDATIKGLSAELNKITAADICIAKRLWDETSIRILLSHGDLRKIIGSVVDDLDAVKQRGRGGSGSFYPGYTMQCIQQMAHVRWGRDPEAACEVVVAPKLLVSNTSDSIWAALSTAIPALSPSQLHELSRRVRILVLYQYPDGFPANRVVMAHLAEVVQRACVFNSHCAAHLLQLVWDTGAQKTLASPLYQLIQLLGNSTTSAKVGGAMEHLALEADTTIGVSLSEGDRKFNQMILDNTVRRPLLVQSFFTEPGGSRHDADSHQRMREQLEETCSGIQDGLSAPWHLPRVCHNCFGPLPGNRCCVDANGVSTRVRRSLRRLNEFSVSSVKNFAANRWRGISTCLAKVAPGVLIHNVVPKAFGRTMATGDELRRLKVLVAEHAERIAAADAAGRRQEDPDAFHVLRGRRIIGANDFLCDPDTPFTLLSFLVGTLPVDNVSVPFSRSKRLQEPREVFMQMGAGHGLGYCNRWLLQMVCCTKCTRCLLTRWWIATLRFMKCGALRLAMRRRLGG